MLRNTVNNLFYLFIFLLPWQTVFILREPIINGEKWQYGTIGIYLTDLILLAWLVAVFLHKAKNLKLKAQNYNLKIKILKNYKFNKNLYLLLTAYYLLLIWSFLSIFWSADKTLAFYFSLKLLLVTGLFITLQKIKINRRKIVFVFLAAAFLQSFLAIGQFAFQESFSSKWLGMNNYEAWQGGVSVLENEGGRWLRAYGSLPHPNILGGYLAIVFLLGLIMWNNMLFPPRNKYGVSFGDLPAGEAGIKLPALKITLASYFSWDKIKKDRVKSLLILSSLLIILLGVLLTFSRSAWLALIVGIIFLSANVNLRKNFIKLLLIFIFAGAVFISLNHENFYTRFNTAERLEQKSISERSLYFSQAKEIIGKNFWLGTGAGNYTEAVFQNDEVKKPIWQYQPVHNVLMLVWAELGIIGLILFSLILISLFLQLYKVKNHNSYSCVILATLCILFFFDHWLWTTHFGILFFWLIAGLMKKKEPVK